MRTMLKKAISDESGKILILVLVLLVVGGLLLGPLLGLMSTGLVAGQVYEKKAAELYAADAGVEDAIWKITSDIEEFPHSECRDKPWDEAYEYGMPSVNAKDVQVTIEYHGGRVYRITSEAATDGSTKTVIAADLFGFSFPENAITSKLDVELGNNSHVEGRIQYGRDFKPKENADYDKDNAVKEDFENWPSSGELYDHYYLKYVKDKYFEYCDAVTCTIDAKYKPTVGPLHRVGSLDLMSSDQSVKRELALTGTVYVTGNLDVGKSPKAKDFTLNLAGQTIFCDGDVYVGGKTDIVGSGSIIAKGHIYFEPNFTSSDGHVLLLALEGGLRFQPTHGEFKGFVMSAEGQVVFRPSGTFYGSVAGDVRVYLDSKVTVIYLEGLGGLVDFPFHAFANWRIRTWNIS